MQTQKRKRRQKGEGSIIQLSNGNYKATITIGRDIAGKQKRRSVTASSKKELMEKLALIRLDKTPAQARTMTLSMLWDEYEREALMDKDTGTKKGYKTLWSRLEADFGGVKLNKFTPQTISSILLSFVCLSGPNKGHPLEGSSLVTNKRRLSAIFKFAIEKEYIVKNPCNGTLKGIRGTKRADLEVMTKEQLKAILEDAKDNDKQVRSNAAVGIHWYPILILAVATGMRRGEIFGLRKSAINVKKGIIDIRAQLSEDNEPDSPLKTKNSYRQLCVDKDILKFVLADSDPESEFVFANRKTHQYLTIGAITASFTTFIRRYGHKPFHRFGLHDFRHYHATQLILNGVDIKSVSRRLGHADIRTTLDRYMHWVLEMDEKASTIIGAGLLDGAYFGA